MASRIETALNYLLTEEGRVGLPGIGTFSLSAESALVSPMEKRALPPSAKVNFNGNLQLDDGKLLQYLVTNHGLEREEGEAEVANFLQRAKETLDAGRSFNVEGIGRLFKQHSGQLIFSGSGVNFGKDNFGLPPVNIQPILRSEKQKTEAVKDPIGGMAAHARTKTRSDKTKSILNDPEINRTLWYVAAAIGAVLVIYLLYLGGRYVATTFSEDNDPVVARVPENRLNVQPGAAEPPPRIGTTPATEVRPEEPPRLNQPPAERPATTPEAPVDPEIEDPVVAPAPARGQEAVIAIGLYGRRSNVEKNVGRLRAAGYEPYTRREGAGTRIGATINYRSEEELFEALVDIRSRFTQDAFVYMIEGELQPIR